MSKPGKSFGQLRHTNRQSWASNNCDGDGDGKVLACGWQRGWKPPCQYLGWSHHAAEPFGCPYSPCLSPPTPTWGKPPPSAMPHGNRAAKQVRSSMTHTQRAFSLAGRSPSARQVKIQPLETKWKHGGTRAPQRQPLAAPPNRHRPLNACSLGTWASCLSCLREGEQDAVRGKGRKAAPLPTGTAGSRDGCPGAPLPGSTLMGRWPRGTESGTRDGPAPWLMLPNQPGTPAALGSQHGISS